MTDDLENLLQRFRPAGPPSHLREKILRRPIPPAAPARHWPIHLFRGAIAALLLLSISLLYAANRLNQDSAARVGQGPPRWTAEAQQAADLLGPGSASRDYIALCLVASHGRPSRNLPSQGADQ
jgi:hypothetical protein